MGLFTERLITRMPIQCIGTKTIKWAKGDDLDKIAKSNGLANGKVIWKDPMNKGIVGKRKKPKNLEVGDELSIPEAPAIDKKLLVVVDKYNKDRASFMTYAKFQEEKIALLEKEIDRLYAIVDKVNRKKFEARDKPKVVELLVVSVNGVKDLLKPIISTQIPFGKVPMQTINGIEKYLKKQVQIMKNAELDEIRLDNLKKNIEFARKGIAAHRKKIVQVEKELDQVGEKTIQSFCKIKGVSRNVNRKYTLKNR